jgi:hypothetical protein
MIEMLKRLEDEDGGVMSMHELDERGDEEDEDELMARLGDIDLGKSFTYSCVFMYCDLLTQNVACMNVYTDSTSADTLWALLPPSKRAAFMKSVQDPDSALARVLLGEVERERGGGAEVPWWVEGDGDEVEELGEDVGEGDNEKIDESRMGRRRLMPAMMELPPSLMVSTSENASQQAERPQGPSLLYNILAFKCVEPLVHVLNFMILTQPTQSCLRIHCSPLRCSVALLTHTTQLILFLILIKASVTTLTRITV